MKTLMLLILLCVSFTSSAQIKLVTLEYPPYITNDEGELDGVAVKLVERLFTQLGKPIEIEVLPWGRAINYIEMGQADGIFTAFKTAKRETFANYIDEALFNQNIVAIKNKKSNALWSKDNISQARICLINNVSYGKWLDEAVEQKLFSGVHRVRTAQQCVKLLQTNRVDFWINNEFGARYVAVKMEVQDQLSIETPPIESTPSYIAFSKKGNVRPEQVQQINAAVVQMKASGEYDQLIDAYFEQLAFDARKN
ncbi:substrate-binding periplasmic protein [Vibrio bivalvicida]|uniref:Substrate-binding periplasmic protein n=1 Tax=Vibrio bivalvicida TaxID=1276888 RepID=A0ABV4MLD8_9VIBR